MVLLLLPTTAYFLLRTAKVQTWLTQKLTTYIKKEYDINTSIGGVNIGLFKSVILEDVYIEDYKTDTLFAAGAVRAHIGKTDFTHKKLYVDNVEIERLKFLYDIDSVSSNLSRFIAAFDSGKPQKKKPKKDKSWELECHNFALYNSFFRFKTPEALDSSDVIDFSNLQLNRLNIIINNLQLRDTISFRIKKLSCVEKSGFVLKNLYTDCRFFKDKILLDDLKIRTPRSKINLSHFYFLFKKWADFSDFTKKIKLNTNIESGSVLNIEDLSYFASDLKGLDHEVTLEGDVQGRIIRLESNQLKITYANKTKFVSSFEISGLPEVDNMHFHFNIKDLTTNVNDIQSLYLYPFNRKEHITLPEITQKLGTVRYKGIFMGLLDDFLVKGTFKTALGTLSPYIRLQPDTINKTTEFKGKLQAENFKLGKLLESEPLIGNITFDIDVDGKQKKNQSPEIILNGKVNNINFNNYNYSNLDFKGYYINDIINYMAMINDPAIKFDIEGNVNLSHPTPRLFVDINLDRANLYALNLDKEDINSSITFDLRANMHGLDFNTFIGDIMMQRGLWYKTTGKMFLNHLKLEFIDQKEEGKQIKLNSDFIDGELVGTYDFRAILPFLRQEMYHYLPVFYNASDSVEIAQWIGNKSNNFNFNIRLNNLDQITQALFPDLKLSQGARVDGIFNSIENFFVVKATAPSLSAYEQNFENFTLNIDGQDSIFNFDLYGRKYDIAQQLNFECFNIKGEIYQNRIPLSIVWDNYDTRQLNKGEISATANFIENPISDFPKIDIDIHPTKIHTGNNLWSIDQSEIHIDSSAIVFNDFKISDRKQHLKLEGTVSEDEKDTLNINANEISLTNFNFLLQDAGLKLKGHINGKNLLTNLYKKPLILANDSIVGFCINDNKIGDVSLFSKWNRDRKDIFLQLGIYNSKQLKTFDCKGFYQPSTGKINFRLKLENFIINFLEDFLKENLSDISGFANTDLITINGTLKKPIIRGRLFMQKAGVKVNYLQSAFTFTDTIFIDRNAIIFNDINLTSRDVYRGTAVLNGSVMHNYFNDFTFDINLDANKFLFLNTTIEDNELYYGRAYASGLVYIYGDIENIGIKVNAKTEKHTTLFIPLTSSSEVNEKTFISFVDKDTLNLNLPEEEQYNVDLTGIELDFNLEITPDAEAQIILDETVGDIIRGRGSGNLEMNINTKGLFEMRGAFEIEKGDYLFTLQNVINKKFEVNKGSRVTWTGDPYNADIDIKAVYKLKKVPIYNLLLDEEKRDTKVPVNCNIEMTEKLMTPKIKFSIDVLEKSEGISTQLNNLPPDELNKQFLSLLVIKSFQPLPGLDPDVDTKSTDYSLSSNAGEFLSNQLSLWLSQISDDFDIGVKYHGSDSISSSQVEVALSTQLLNDRMIINGNVNMGGQQNTSTSNFVGEFDIEYKITKNGKLRVKYYNKANDDYLFGTSPYKQGVGIFYRKDFDKFREIFKREEQPPDKPEESDNNKEATKKDKEKKKKDDKKKKEDE